MPLTCFCEEHFTGLSENYFWGKKCGSVPILFRTVLENAKLESAAQCTVADPGCLSRIPDPNFSIPDPGSRVTKISDLGSTSKNLKNLSS